LGASKKNIKAKEIHVDVEMKKKMIKEDKAFANKVNRLVPFIEKNTFMWMVKREKGGKIPSSLLGKFTSERIIREAILQYDPHNFDEVVEVA